LFKKGRYLTAEKHLDDSMIEQDRSLYTVSICHGKKASNEGVGYKDEGKRMCDGSSLVEDIKIPTLRSTLGCVISGRSKSAASGQPRQTATAKCLELQAWKRKERRGRA